MTKSIELIHQNFDELESYINNYDTSANRILALFMEQHYQDDIQKIINQLNQDIDDYDFESAHTSLEQLRLALPLKDTSIDQATNSNEFERVKEKLYLAQKQVNDYDTSALELLHEIIGLTHDRSLQISIEKICKELDDYNFDQAAAILNELLKN